TQGYVRRGMWLGDEDPAPLPMDASESSKMPAANTLLADTEELLAEGVDPMDLVDDDAEYLGVASSIARSVGYTYRRVRMKPETALRKGLLEWLRDEKRLELTYEDDVYKKVDKHVDESIDFVIAGHTHLARAIERPRGGVYFNSGT